MVVSSYIQYCSERVSETRNASCNLRSKTLLRMEAEVTRERRIERVNKVIKELGLTKCQDTRAAFLRFRDMWYYFSNRIM
ncbi:hypothetical protein DPMN_156118 [Dreissena polymorpha]|uniref:Uncharacterized protein n=1 Tax=Dreissena polymorpha TaxID=45954 RepID=A0A9D4FQN1_DREPO|nr:hypothetical protein DPMN_156118 [Dreissena polymorpha]